MAGTPCSHDLDARHSPTGGRASPVIARGQRRPKRASSSAARWRTTAFSSVARSLILPSGIAEMMPHSAARFSAERSVLLNVHWDIARRMHYRIVQPKSSRRTRATLAISGVRCYDLPPAISSQSKSSSTW